MVTTPKRLGRQQIAKYDRTYGTEAERYGFGATSRTGYPLIEKEPNERFTLRCTAGHRRQVTIAGLIRMAKGAAESRLTAEEIASRIDQAPTEEELKRVLAVIERECRAVVLI